MIMKVTKLQYRALNNLDDRIEVMANKLGIPSDEIEGWEKDCMDYVSAKNYFLSLQVAQGNGQNCTSILNDIRKYIEIVDD